MGKLWQKNQKYSHDLILFRLEIKEKKKQKWEIKISSNKWCHNGYMRIWCIYLLIEKLMPFLLDIQHRINQNRLKKMDWRFYCIEKGQQNQQQHHW